MLERFDADGHVIEPPQTWQNRVPSHLKGRAPKVVTLSEDSEAWSFEDGKRVIPIHGTFSTPGVSPIHWNNKKMTYKDMRPGAYDPKARLEDMTTDMIYGVVLHPSIGLLQGAHTFTETDRELQLACVAAYNDWLAEEYCSADLNRLHGLAMMPTTGVDDAVAELKRTFDIPGLHGALLGAYPNGSQYPLFEDDRFWALAQELEQPVVIHIKLMGTDPNANEGEGAVIPDNLPPGLRVAGVNGERTGAGIMLALAQIICTGILERFPKLRVVGTETGCGFVPYFMEQLDDNFLRHRFWTGADIPMLPSEYVKRQCYFTFQIDSYGIRNRDQMLHNIMWSTDYPHSGADWPNSVVTIERNLAGVPEHERNLILRDNCIRAFGLTTASGPSA